MCGLGRLQTQVYDVFVPSRTTVQTLWGQVRTTQQQLTDVLVQAPPAAPSPPQAMGPRLWCSASRRAPCVCSSSPCGLPSGLCDGTPYGPEAQRQITTLLRERHRLKSTQDNDFQIRNLADVAATAQSTSQSMSILLASVASVSLVVGGIGIMNIMLVSVTERTREIGIRMAVGAKRRDILTQFLLEAVVLSTLGGLWGVVLGIIGSQLVSALAAWPTIVPLEAILLAVVFSGAVGVFFGFYPARKAAYLDPIEALRYE